MSMKEYLHILKKVPLFSGLEACELESLLGCLSAVKRSYKKNTFILRAGDEVRSLGIVLAGEIQICREDASGSRIILASLGAGSLFAEAFVCSNTKILPVTVLSAAESSILFVDYRRIITTCPAACPFHTRIIQNMLAILADKNILLSRKIEHISQRTTREKLLSYLQAVSAEKHSREFSIPFNRQELADYLCVDRSAMSAALSKMQEEGLLSYSKNRFALRD